MATISANRVERDGHVMRRALASCALVCGALSIRAAEPEKIGFNEHIRPILAENCFACHGPDSAARKAKLRLDHFEFATAARDDLPAISPGQPERSAVMERITSTDDDDRMPPPETHKRLTREEIERLKRWIREGASYEPHWSFLPPKRPGVPTAGAGWARNPIDRFVAAKLGAAGLQPNPPENPERLLRRVTLDLTGLPPMPDDYASFLSDPSAVAYDRVVDRLLASDACAEHLTRYWLDAVRYADTHGLSLDNYRSIWPYRDWVLRAFKGNMPFDRFTIEQIAGDLLPNATLDQRVASGFNRLLPTTDEGGVIPAEYEAIYARDRVETMSTVWLGLTTGCAACHDHKFDPITTKEFYALTAFFRNHTIPTLDGSLAEPRPTVFVPALEDRLRWDELQRELRDVQAAWAQRSAEPTADAKRWLLAASTLPNEPDDYSLRLHLPLLAPPADPSANVSGIFGPAPDIRRIEPVAGPTVPLLRDGELGLGFLMCTDGAANGPVLSCLDEDQRATGWEVFLEDGRLGFYASDREGGIRVRAVAKQLLAPNTWHHVFLHFEGRASRNRLLDLYVDGALVASVGEAGSSNETLSFSTDINPQAPLRFASFHSAIGGNARSRLDGGRVWIQDLRLHDRAFSVPEIRRLAEITAVDAALRAPAASRTSEQTARLTRYYFAAVDVRARELQSQINRLRDEERALRRRGGVTLVMEEKRESEPAAHVLYRGDYSQPRERVTASTPAALHPLSSHQPGNRLGLVHWLVDPANPLVARVTVNRMWQMVFGTGLAETTGDFGITGALPSHPELLDWLAVEFQEHGWDLRRVLRLLVTSSTYRQSATILPAILERDPGNRLLARGPRLRLDGEVLRDQALAAAGMLAPRFGGPSVRPWQPPGVWEDVAMKKSTTRFYEPNRGNDLYRRSVYTIWKRIAPPALLEMFNAPNRMVACVRRDITNTPLQALAMLNEPLFMEAARALAGRALPQRPDFDSRLDEVSRRLLGRTFEPDERASLRNMLEYLISHYRRDTAAAQALLAIGTSAAPPDLPAAELCAWTILTNEIMNLDEALTK